MKLYSNERGREGGGGGSLVYGVTNYKGLPFEERASSRMLSPIAP